MQKKILKIWLRKKPRNWKMLSTSHYITQKTDTSVFNTRYTFRSWRARLHAGIKWSHFKHISLCAFNLNITGCSGLRVLYSFSLLTQVCLCNSHYYCLVCVQTQVRITQWQPDTLTTIRDILLSTIQANALKVAWNKRGWFSATAFPKYHTLAITLFCTAHLTQLKQPGQINQKWTTHIF